MGDDQYTSVTTLIDTYKMPFDRDFWATYKALERLIGEKSFIEMKRHSNFKSPAWIEWACKFVEMDELLKTISIILQEWENEKNISLEKGTMYHLSKEKQAYIEGYDINPFTGKKFPTMMKKPSKNSDKVSMVSDLWDLKDGYYPELMLWNNSFRIAGTADKVFIDTVGNVRYIDFDDYKTNKKIKKENPYEKMRSPLNSLDNCEWSFYRLQISMYAWMMEQFGFKVRYTAFTHFNEMYKFSYGHMRKHIIALLNDYSKKLNNGTI